MKKIYFLWMFLFSFAMHAQPASETINANNIKATVNANGAFFWDFNEGQFLTPFGPGNISTIRSSGLWFAGIDQNGNLKGAVQMYNENDRSDFQPGLLVWDNEIFDDVNLIWKVTKADVEAHIADFNDNGVVDNPIASIFGYPGRGNGFFYNYHNFELPSNSAGLAPFYNLDGDFSYDPDDGEYPVVDIRGCNDEEPIVADEMLWFVHHDVKVHTESQMEPLSVSVASQVFAFNCSGNPLLDNTVFVHHKVIYYGDSNLDSTHIALFTDFDIGCADDDFIGCNPEHNVHFAYNSDNDDAGCNNTFGSNPPVQAVTMLRGPHAPKVYGANGELENPGPGQFADTLVQIKPTFYVPFGYDNGNMGTPSGPDFFKYLSGSWKDDSAMENNGVYYDGDPIDPAAWSEVSDGNAAGDRRMLATFGPFDLHSGSVNEIILAYSAFQNPSLPHLQNVSAIYQNADSLQAVFDNCFIDVCSFTSGINTPSFQISDLRIFPNPNDGNFVLEYQSGNRYEVIDVAGRVLVSGSLPVVDGVESGVHVFDVSILDHGIYFLKVSGQKEIDVVKFVVK